MEIIYLLYDEIMYIISWFHKRIFLLFRIIGYVYKFGLTCGYLLWNLEWGINFSLEGVEYAIEFYESIKNYINDENTTKSIENLIDKLKELYDNYDEFLLNQNIFTIDWQID